MRPVQVEETKPTGLRYMLLIVLSLFMWKEATGQRVSPFLAGAFIILAAHLHQHHWTLWGAGGETKALTSQQHKYVADVVAALDESIVHGGA